MPNAADALLLSCFAFCALALLFFILFLVVLPRNERRQLQEDARRYDRSVEERGRWPGPPS